MPRRRIEGLSDRERQVMELVVKGYRNEEIAKELIITENTVESHLRSIYKKLNVPNRTAAAFTLRK